MVITVSQLQGVDSGSLQYFGFGDASGHAGDASGRYDAQVRTPIEGGHGSVLLGGRPVWSGEGQPEAAATIKINSIALDVSKFQMQSGHLVMDSFQSALTKAHRNLMDTIAQAPAKDYKVHDDGTVEKVGDDGDDEKAGKLTKVIKSILIFASIADHDASTLLGKIAGATPVVSDRASLSALRHNEQTLLGALHLRTITVASHTQWTNARPVDWKTYDEKEGHVLEKVYSFLSGAGRGIGLISLGVLGEGLGVVADATVVGAAFGIPAAVVSGGFIAAGAADLAHGWASTIGQHGEIPDNNGAPRPQPVPDVDDPSLQQLVYSYYGTDESQVLKDGSAAVTGWTVADIERYKNATGQPDRLGPQVGGADVPAPGSTGGTLQPGPEGDPEQIKAQVQDWYDKNKDDPDVSAKDKETARYMLGELDAAEHGR